MIDVATTHVADLQSTILVVEDNPNHLLFMTDRLEAEGYKTLAVSNGEKALDLIKKKPPDVVLLDIMLPGINGIEVLQVIRKKAPDVVVIMTTALDEVDKAVESMKLGAHEYLVKPIKFGPLNTILKRVGERISLKMEVERLRELQREKFTLGEVVVADPKMKRIFSLAKKLGETDLATVLITGETGTGKEIIARTIHLSSPRFEQPLVVVNCGAIPKELIESELIGYAKGAFTGAAKEGKKGKVELAHQGTLLLDEIGELPLPAQTILLRILDGQPFYPVGSTSEVSVDVRIIAATNRDLEYAVAEGKFRKDLFFRLNVAHIDVPALRERIEDILPLAKKFLHEFNQKYGKSFQGYSKEAASKLKAFPWLGNIRELKNVIERFVLYEEASEVRPEHLSYLKRDLTGIGSTFILPREGIDLENVFKEFIVQALELTLGNQAQAARLLGISFSTLRYRMNKYGLKEYQKEATLTLSGRKGGD